MKKFSFLFAILFTVGTSFAQRIVYVDTDYILKQIPEYAQATEQLEQQVAAWNEEIAQSEQNYIDMKSSYEEKKLLLPEKLKLEEEQKLEKARQNLQTLKQQRLGVKGDVFKKQQALIKPIQDKIYNAIKQMAEQRDYDFVLDKSTGVSILFVKPKFDMSDEVLRIINRSNNN